jgi:hypothetical protein
VVVVVVVVAVVVGEVACEEGGRPNSVPMSKVACDKGDLANAAWSNSDCEPPTGAVAVYAVAGDGAGWPNSDGEPLNPALVSAVIGSAVGWLKAGCAPLAWPCDEESGESNWPNSAWPCDDASGGSNWPNSAWPCDDASGGSNWPNSDWPCDEESGWPNSDRVAAVECCARVGCRGGGAKSAGALEKVGWPNWAGELPPSAGWPNWWVCCAAVRAGEAAVEGAPYATAGGKAECCVNCACGVLAMGRANCAAEVEGVAAVDGGCCAMAANASSPAGGALPTNGLLGGVASATACPVVPPTCICENGSAVLACICANGSGAAAVACALGTATTG